LGNQLTMARPSNTAARQRQIVEGLLTVMSEGGYEGASVALVARAAGLAPGLVHYHFASKQAILLRLVEHLGALLEERLSRRLAGAKDARGRLKAFVEVHLALGPDADERVLACWVAIAAEAIRQPEVAKEFGAVLKADLERLQVLVRDARREAGRPTRDAKALAASVLAAINGAYLLAAASPDLIPRGSAAKAVWKLIDGQL
jgi:TetR/AcrR family transcriptional repressor of bet genes